jgi:four helix bundle protein
MAFKFENLKVWQTALLLTTEISDLCKAHFPDFEKYSLSNQIRKASDSVVLNIAEGCTGQSNAEFARFLGYALRSAIEVVSCLFIAKNKAYIPMEIFQKYYNHYELLCKMITKLRGSL